MQISAFSDHTFRILIFLAMEPDRSVSTREIAETFDLSFDHLSKSAQFLSREGYVTATRGRGGGMRLARAPSDISIGAVLRGTEAGGGLVECLRAGPKPVQCRLAPICGLTGLFMDANDAFFAALDRRTLADALPGAPAFRRQFGLDRSLDLETETPAS